MRGFAASFFVGTLVLLVLPRLPEMGVLFWGVAVLALLSLVFGAAKSPLTPLFQSGEPERVDLLLPSFAKGRSAANKRLGGAEGGFRGRWSNVVRQIVRVLSSLLLGACYAIWIASGVRADWLPPAWEGEDILLAGTIADVPERGVDGLHFLLDAETPDYHGRLRVAWYADDVPDVRAGERWQLLVRGKQPNGFMNPGGFDYEKWLFAQRIGGSAYVRNATDNHRLAAAPWWSINNLRQRVKERIEATLQGSAMTGLVQGLAIAYTDTIQQEQWEVLRKTGTIHLLAISGLHITMVAGLGIIPVWLVWRLWPGLYLRLPLRIAAGIAGGGLATAYSLLAGFNIPTQRTLIMLLVLLAGLVWRRQVPFSVTLSLALLLVLLLDPLACLSVGFWLSFLTVGLLVWLGGRQRKLGKSAVVWMQLVLSLGTIPLVAGFFGMVSLSSPLANLLAIPVVTFVVTPLVLLGIVLTGWWSAGAALVWQGAALLLEGLMQVLAWLADLPLSAVQMPLIPLPWLVLAMLGFLLLCLPRGLPGRWLGILLMLPVVLFQPVRPEPGAFRVAVLDVGQGLASVVQTANHTLVFDTGPRVSDSFDTGELVLLPWLYGAGIRQIDTLVVSHADNDHSGGAQAVLATMPVTRVLANAPQILSFHNPDLCVAGQGWQWDGVEFTMLHPATNFPEQQENNRSCVLKIANGHHSMLLAADIERPAELWLAKQEPDLEAEVVLVPHHGSKTSSSPAFLKAVNPRLGIVTSGYRNRFHHPHPSVVQRYASYGINLLDTVNSGELRLDFPVSPASPVLREWRKVQNHCWSRY